MSMDSASARLLFRAEHRPDMDKAERLRLWPGTLFCDDFEGVGQCCGPILGLDENPGGFCHQSLNNLIIVYPESCYSVKHRHGKMPDIGFGLHAEVCCGKYEAVKQLPRSYWIQRLGAREGWSDAHVAQLLAATPERWYQVRGEITDYYYALRNPSSVRQASTPLGSVGRATVRKATSRGTGISISKCPSCGQKWSGDVCENCGHGGGI